MTRLLIVSIGSTLLFMTSASLALPVLGGPQANADSAPGLPIGGGAAGAPSHGWGTGIVGPEGYPESYQQAITLDGQMVANGLSGGSGISGRFAFDTPAFQPASGVLRLNAINENGIAVGRSTVHKPVRWDGVSSSAEVLNVPLINGVSASSAEAFDLNQSGVAIGYATAGGRYRALRWTPESIDAVVLESVNLGPNGLPKSAATRDINDQGDVVGYSEEYVAGSQPYSRYRAVKWLAGSTTPTLLARGGNSDFAYAVNESGVTVGCTDFFRAARWDASGQTIERLGAAADGQTSYAWDINNVGSSVGWAMKLSQTSAITRYQALRWDADGTDSVYLQNLATPPNYEALSVAVAINDLGYVAGSAYRLASANGTVGGMGAVVWRPDATAIDLSLLVEADSGWRRLCTAYGVTSTGFVNGVGIFDPDGTGPTASYFRVFMMLVPEAGTYGRGDADFDTDVDFADLLLLAQHYGQANTALDVHVADLNLDGSVNFSDLLTLAQHYGSGAAVVDVNMVGADFAADWALVQSLVPEPASMATLLSFVAVGRRRR